MKMANVFAAYIDSSDTWGFQQESYDSQIGFYTNAWVNNSRESTEETTTHPCSYFYQVGKEDEVGFTPTRITINDTNGILTVAGRQKNVASILSKSFRVSSPSPRFFNLRESRRNRRPARILVSNIITDDNEELINIKNHLNIDIEVEEVAISRAEEFGAEGDSPQVRNITNVDDKVYVTVYFPDANYGYERIFEGNMEEVMLNDYETPSGKLRTFGAERGYVGNCADCGKYTQTICDSCGELCCCGVGSDHERADVRLLWDDSDNICNECFTDTFQEIQAEEFEAKGDSHKCPECGSESSMQRRCSHCNNEWEIDIGQFGAESFEADDDGKTEKILQLLSIVQRKATGSNAAYAKAYANEAMNAYYQYGVDGLKTQVAYTLSNLSGWRGEEAKSVKAQLKKLIK